MRASSYLWPITKDLLSQGPGYMSYSKEWPMLVGSWNNLRKSLGGGNCTLMLILCATKEVGAQSGFVIASSRHE